MTTVAVFLSYARDDWEHVEPLRQELEDLCGDVWMDIRLVGGQEWWDEILEQIRECRVFVLAVGRHSIHSAACLAEMDYGRAVGRATIGVRIDDAEVAGLPDALRRRQLVDFRERDVAGVRSLARALLAVDPAPPLPDPLPPAPPLPLSYVDRFADIFSPQLDLDQQLSAFAKLRFDIENGAHVSTATELLDHLYVRQDLSWRLRDDIDRFRRELAEAVEPELSDEDQVGTEEFEDDDDRTTLEVRLLSWTNSSRELSILSSDGHESVLDFVTRPWLGQIIVKIDGVTRHRGSWSDPIRFESQVAGQITAVEVVCLATRGTVVTNSVIHDLQLVLDDIEVYTEDVPDDYVPEDP